jgi:hypothetical protein
MLMDPKIADNYLKEELGLKRLKRFISAMRSEEGNPRRPFRSTEYGDACPAIGSHWLLPVRRLQNNTAHAMNLNNRVIFKVSAESWCS